MWKVGGGRGEEPTGKKTKTHVQGYMHGLAQKYSKDGLLLSLKTCTCLNTQYLAATFQDPDNFHKHDCRLFIPVVTIARHNGM